MVKLPSRETAIAHNWRYQVDWIEQGRPCFVRYKYGEVADAFARKIRKQGLEPTVTDLRDALQLN